MQNTDADACEFRYEYEHNFGNTLESTKWGLRSINNLFGELYCEFMKLFF